MNKLGFLLLALSLTMFATGCPAEKPAKKPEPPKATDAHDHDHEGHDHEGHDHKDGDHDHKEGDHEHKEGDQHEAAEGTKATEAPKDAPKDGQ
jgi:hypothetical protein